MPAIAPVKEFLRLLQVPSLRHAVENYKCAGLRVDSGSMIVITYKRDLKTKSWEETQSVIREPKWREETRCRKRCCRQSRIRNKVPFGYHHRDMPSFAMRPNSCRNQRAGRNSREVSCKLSCMATPCCEVLRCHRNYQSPNTRIQTKQPVLWPTGVRRFTSALALDQNIVTARIPSPWSKRSERYIADNAIPRAIAGLLG